MKFGLVVFLTIFHLIRSFQRHQWLTKLGQRLSLNPIDTVNKPLSERSPQVLQFTEPTTNKTVILVGTMHYNPTSINLASTTVEKIAGKGKLGAVLLEVCASRWQVDTVKEVLPPKDPSIIQRRKFIRNFFGNEMLAAADQAKNYNIPIVLADQCINKTMDKIKSSLKTTAIDMFTPWNGGWSSISKDLALNFPLAFPTGEGYLGLNDFLDPSLLLEAPAAFAKYSVAFMLGGPLGIMTWGGLFLLGLLTQSDSTYLPETPLEEIANFITSASGLIAELAFLSRIFLIAIVVDRNQAMAESILKECERLVTDGNPEDSVVAVMGMVHCNGIKKLLESRMLGKVTITEENLDSTLLKEN